MKCENIFCIYCDNGECFLENISINSFGMCDECILVDLDKEFLNKEKKKQNL